MRKKMNLRIKELVLEHLELNWKVYLVVFAFFITGILVGIYIIQHLSSEQKNDMICYINNTIDVLKGDTQIDNISLLKNSVANNIVLCLIIWFVGSTVIGLPVVYGIVAFKGFSIGYTISAIIAVLGTGNGMIFTITTMLLQNIINIPCILALAVSATRLCGTILKDRSKENIKFGIIKHTFFSAIICVFLVISSFVEVYVSTALFSLSLAVY